MSVDSKTVKELLKIAKIPKGSKLWVSDEGLKADTWSIFQGASRYFGGQNREKGVRALSETCENAMEAAKTEMDSTSLNLVKFRTLLTEKEYSEYKTKYTNLSELAGHLSNSLIGIKNLQETYNNQVIELELVVSKITKTIEAIQNHLAGLSQREKELQVPGCETDLCVLTKI